VPRSVTSRGAPGSATDTVDATQGCKTRVAKRPASWSLHNGCRQCV
jgi:hypothetical protein